MKDYEPIFHTRGESLFIDDIPEPAECIYLTVFTSPVAHGRIKYLNFNDCKKINGVLGILAFKDIPGENQIGGVIPDEPLFAEKLVDYIGQPIAIIAATSKLIARKALKFVKAEFQELEPITDPRVAAAKGKYLGPVRVFQLGNIDDVWKECDYIFEGVAETGGQEHLYLETQGALAIPEDKNKIKVYSATQAPTAVQKCISRVLGIDMHLIEIEVKRLGGGFGGKEDQASSWAAMAALAAKHFKRPAKIVLKRKEDMRYTGKRHPYSSDFKIGLSKDLKIKAYEATYYQNGGAATDLSLAILERSLFHSTNSYFIPNVKITAHPCKTNLAPNTAFRGFGGPQAMFVIESAIAKAAHYLGIDAVEIQKRNLIKDGDIFPYGMKVKLPKAMPIFNLAIKKFQYEKWKKQIDSFNSKNRHRKKGLAVMPVCFGISFTTTFLNQGNALVHIYTDGSVLVSTGGVEMGQGVNNKIALVAAETLGIPREWVMVQYTNTTKNPNTSPTAASTGSDLNSKATEVACLEILDRLKKLVSEKFSVKSDEVFFENGKIINSGGKIIATWKKLIQTAYTSRVDLSAHGYYAPPGISFDRTKEKGEPFAYHVFGTAILEATVDILRGISQINKVKIIHDVGKSIDPITDLGQIEGGLVQGLGWMTMEEIMHNEKGKLLSDSFATYKVPDVHFTPDIETVFYKDSYNPYAVRGSKAVGEPPFMYGIGAYFAILNAIKAYKRIQHVEFIAPMTPERILSLLT